LEEIYSNPNYIHAIAHPDDTDIRDAIEHLLPLLKKIGIKHFWVAADDSVIEE
jgi:hypothetical protein